MIELWPYAALTGALLVFGIYLLVVLRGADDLGRTSREVRERLARQRAGALRGLRDRAVARGAPSEPAPAPVTQNRRAPTIRAAQGTVATASALRGVSGRDELIRTLAEGPDYRRRSAARALSVPFAGTRDPVVVAALADTIRNDEFGFTVRAEAYCALRAVMGQHLEWKEEVEVRRGFPDGADFGWVEDAERDACAPETT
jgi:hypothetical protein